MSCFEKSRRCVLHALPMRTMSLYVATHAVSDRAPEAAIIFRFWCRGWSILPRTVSDRVARFWAVSRPCRTVSDCVARRQNPRSRVSVSCRTVSARLRVSDRVTTAYVVGVR